MSKFVFKYHESEGSVNKIPAEIFWGTLGGILRARCECLNAGT